MVGGMARPLRIEFPSALYHVTSRGDRREPIFEDDEDRLKFLDVLAEVVGRFNWLCHAQHNRGQSTTGVSSRIVASQ